MRKRVFLIVVCLIGLLSQNVAFGRLGESREKCIERYGSISGEKQDGLFTVLSMPNEAGPAMTFRIWLHKGVCKAIEYSSRKKITEDMVNELLEKNSEGHKWEAIFNDPVARNKQGYDSGYWKRSDGGDAGWSWYALIIKSSDFEKLVETGKQEEKKQKDAAKKKMMDGL